MERWIEIPIGTKCYRPRPGTQSVERLINLRASLSRPGAKTASSVLNTPGLLPWTEVGDGPIRGLHHALNYVWAVSGDELYAIVPGSLTATLIGQIGDTGPVRMINNDTHIAVCAVGFSYAANLSGVITLPEGNLSGAAMLDGYGVFAQRHTKNLFVAGPDDLTTIDPLDFTTVDTQPDKIVSCIQFGRLILALKEKTGEFFYNSGDPDFPLTRVDALLERGLYSPGSLAKDDKHVLWLGDDKRVHELNGYASTPVSTEDIERLISCTASPETSEAFIYTEEGQTVYSLNFSDLSLEYNLTTKEWNERQTYGLDRWRAQGHCTIPGANLVGDYETGQIYELDPETYTDNDEIALRTMHFPPLSASPQWVTVHELHVDMKAGVGLITGQGSSPKMLLSWSDDDGETWSNDIEESLGDIGQRRYRAHFNCLGEGYNRTFRIRISDPVEVAFLGARARIEVGAQ